jgi:nucleoside-diphosphate-sugar epimerase
VAHRFAERATRGLTLEVHGDGRQTIDFAYVKDGAHAICSLLQASDRAWNQTYNIVSGHSVGIMELAQLCCSMAGSVKAIQAPIERFDVSRTPVSCGSSHRLARDLLGRSQRVLLNAGLEEVMARISKERGREGV